MRDFLIGLAQVSVSDSSLFLSRPHMPTMASIRSSYGSEKPDQPVGGSSTPSSTMAEQKDEKFVLGSKGFLVFFTLAVLTLMAALDGTSLSVALPVSFILRHIIPADISKDYSTSLEWYSN